ncbi:MAG: hypothetical protein IJV69_05670 [Kiritimatiellae bacterium]|nr:hypothetical protein [Kiritimatiellia bacterium]
MKRSVADEERKILSRFYKRTHVLRHSSDWKKLWDGRNEAGKVALSRHREREDRRRYAAECLEFGCVP